MSHTPEERLDALEWMINRHWKIITKQDERLTELESICENLARIVQQQQGYIAAIEKFIGTRDSIDLDTIVGQLHHLRTSMRILRSQIL